MTQLPAHLRVPWGIGSALVVYLLSWLGATFALVLVLWALSPVLPFADQYLQAINRGDITANFILTFFNAVVAIILVALYLRHFRVPWSTLGWRSFNIWRTALFLLGIFVTFLIASNLLLFLVALLVPGFDSQQAQTNDFTASTVTNPRLTLIALVILPPIIEETVFRGFIFPAFAKKWGVIWGAIISSTLFGFAHLQANVGIYTFVMGMLLCFLYVKLKSIIPGIFFHMLNNYLAFVALSGK